MAMKKYSDTIDAKGEKEFSRPSCGNCRERKASAWARSSPSCPSWSASLPSSNTGNRKASKQVGKRFL